MTHHYLCTTPSTGDVNVVSFIKYITEEYN